MRRRRRAVAESSDGRARERRRVGRSSDYRLTKACRVRHLCGLQSFAAGHRTLRRQPLSISGSYLGPATDNGKRVYDTGTEERAIKHVHSRMRESGRRRARRSSALVSTKTVDRKCNKVRVLRHCQVGDRKQHSRTPNQRMELVDESNRGGLILCRCDTSASMAAHPGDSRT